MFGEVASLALTLAAAGPTASLEQACTLWRGVIDRPRDESKDLRAHLSSQLKYALEVGLIVHTQHERFPGQMSFRFQEESERLLWRERWRVYLSPQLRQRAHSNLANWMTRQLVTEVARPQLTVVMIEHWLEAKEPQQAALTSLELSRLFLTRGETQHAKRSLQRTLQLLGPDGVWPLWREALEQLFTLNLDSGESTAAELIASQIIERAWRLEEMTLVRQYSAHLERIYKETGREEEAQSLIEWSASLPLDGQAVALFGRSLTAMPHASAAGRLTPLGTSRVELSSLRVELNQLQHSALPPPLPPAVQLNLHTPSESPEMSLPEIHTLRAPPPSILSVLVALRDRGHEAYVVGGSVRDRLLGRDVNDWDVTTSALPHEVSACFKRVLETGLQHGTVTVLIDEEHIEVTTYRVDGEYEDGRRPESVTFTRSLPEDLLRRDFTVNAIAWDPINARLCDPHDGVKDLQRQVLRAVGDPQARFCEDALRVLRAIRFSATLDFEIEAETISGAYEARKMLHSISAERIQVELFKTLKGGSVRRGLELMRELEVIPFCLPELPPLAESTWARLCAAMEEIKSDELATRLALIFHVYQSAHQHTKPELARLVKRSLKQLKVSNKLLSMVTHLVTFTALNPAQRRSDTLVRALVAEIGLEALDEVRAYREAWLAAAQDRVVTHLTEPELSDDLIPHQVHDTTTPQELEAWAALYQRIDELEARSTPLVIRDLATNGRVLCEAFDLFPSREVGELLHELLRWVWGDPTRNHEEVLLERARVLAIERGLIADEEG